MRRLITTVIVLGICVVGFGFYRGWFALSNPDPATGSNQVNVNLTVDTNKMKEDAATVKDKATELTGNVTEGPAVPADRPTDGSQPSQAPPADVQPKRAEPNAVPSNRD